MPLVEVGRCQEAGSKDVTPSGSTLIRYIPGNFNSGPLTVLDSKNQQIFITTRLGYIEFRIIIREA